MSRIVKWKTEKAKVKVVFRLQFHATHIPQPGWDKLFVSFIPLDTGKATAKTTKATVRNGNCKWSDPIYETTRLLQDTRTKKYDEKLYKLIVAMGSSRAGLLGEATINLADYADASKPASVALGLHGSNSGTVLHVTVQLLTSKTGFREFEQQRELRDKGLEMVADQSSHDEPDDKVLFSAVTTNGQIDKVNAKVRFRADLIGLPSLEEEGEMNEDYAESPIGIDGSSCTSESLCTEKHDISSAHEVDSIKSTTSGELGGFSLNQRSGPEKIDQSDLRLLAQRSNDWVHGWSSDNSIDNDSATAYEENSRLRGNLEVAESSILELTKEVRSLQIHADELGAETQSLSQQLVAEISLGEELIREVSVLKSECAKVKHEFEALKASKSNLQYHLTEVIPVNNEGNVVEQASIYSKLDNNVTRKRQDCVLHNFDMKWLQSLSLMEKKVREIKNKACVGECNFDLGLLHPEIEALECVLWDLKQETARAASSLNVGQAETIDLHIDKIGFGDALPANVSFGGLKKDIGATSLQNSRYFMPNGLHLPGNTEGYNSEKKLHCSSCSGGVSREIDSIESNLDTSVEMKEKICELLIELDESKTEQDSLKKKMEQMECYYEALIQELEESHRQMEEELQNIRGEHSTCLQTISTFESQLGKMHQDMNEQFLRFSEEKRSMDSLNMELEKRAATSEMALGRMRWNYSIAVDQLHKDLELLSFQVLSMYETNENLARQAFAEASQVCLQEYLQEDCGDINSSSNKDDPENLFLKEQYKTKVQGTHSEVNLPKKNLQDLSSKPDNKSMKFDDKTESKADYFIGNKGISLTEVPADGELQTFSKDGHYSFLKSKFDFQESDSQNAVPKKQLLEQQLLLEEAKKALTLQEELFYKAETELSEVHQLNIHLSVYSKVLQETVLEANAGIRLMEEKTEELKQQLEHSNDFTESLILKLQISLDDVKHMRESEAKCLARCDDFTLENHSLQTKLREISDENCLLTQKIIESEKLMTEYRSYKSMHEACAVEKTDLEKMLQKENLDKSNLQSEISSIHEDLRILKLEMDKQTSLKDDLEKTVDFLQDKLEEMRFKMVAYHEQVTGPSFTGEYAQQELENKGLMSSILHLEELQQKAYEKLLKVSQEKKDAEGQRAIVQGSLKDTESQIFLMKEKFESDMQNIMTKLDVSNAHAEDFEAELQDVVYKLKVSSEAEEKCREQNKMLSLNLTNLEMELQNSISENRDLAQKMATFESLNRELEKATRDFAQRITTFESLNEELERAKVMVNDFMTENKSLRVSLAVRDEDFVQQAKEFDSLRESLGCSRDELQLERDCRYELEAKFSYLTSQLNEKHEKLLYFREQEAEWDHLKKHISGLELENSKLKQLFSDTIASQRKATEDASCLCHQISDLETDLAAMHEYLLASDVEVTFLKFQFQIQIQDLVNQLESSEKCREELQSKQLDAVTSLNNHVEIEAQFKEEIATLLTELSSLRSEVETAVNEKRELEDYFNRKSDIWAETENWKAKAAVAEIGYSQEKLRCDIEIEQLKGMLEHSEEELDNMRSSRDELEIMVVVLRSKLDEQLTLISLLNEHSDELMKLRSQHNELTRKLSEQILKTEEFKNLCIHLRDLKEKSDADSQVREKRETEGPVVTMQDSLRVAFIREQCETKLQDLRSQLFASKKHGEEMLLKLQNALDELEIQKKSEATRVKINEELSMRVLELEKEIQLVLSDKREKVKSYDGMKAELECAMISLDCCKEEKQKVEICLKECNEERARITVELDLIKGQLEGSKSFSRIAEQGKHETGTLDSMTIESYNLPLPEVEGSDSISAVQNQAQIVGDCCLGRDAVDMVVKNETIDNLGVSGESAALESSCRDLVGTDLVTIDEKELPIMQRKLLSLQDEVVSKSASLEASRQELIEKDALLQNNIEQVTLISKRFKEQCLNSSMDHLHKELEKMKKENLGLFHSQDEHCFDPDFQGVVQKEMLQLHMANEQLGNLFPLFNEFPGSGNALERVLALEIELAEALQAKKKSKIHFQSSFLKQHKDEEAIFQSFRDINELIKDMLKLKRRNAVVENELKEMQDRYSQLSLQFAEVEGERQQLVMTLKNIRVPKKP